LKKGLWGSDDYLSLMVKEKNKGSRIRDEKNSTDLNKGDTLGANEPKKKERENSRRRGSIEKGNSP